MAHAVLSPVSGLAAAALLSRRWWSVPLALVLDRRALRTAIPAARARRDRLAPDRVGSGRFVRSRRRWSDTGGRIPTGWLSCTRPARRALVSALLSALLVNEVVALAEESRSDPLPRLLDDVWTTSTKGRECGSVRCGTAPCRACGPGSSDVDAACAGRGVHGSDAREYDVRP